jgi:hypothetical protein
MGQDQVWVRGARCRGRVAFANRPRTFWLVAASAMLATGAAQGIQRK